MSKQSFSLFGDLEDDKKPKSKKIIIKKNRKKISEEKKITPDFLGRIFAVGEFLDFVNDLLSAPGVFSVQGEITEFKTHPTGIYFSLKDKEEGKGILQCYMPPYVFRSAGILIEDGMEVKINGSPNIYKAKGRFSFLTRSIELTGEGSLKKSYELLKKKLESEGLFERKRILPEFVKNIAVITSKTGAVIDDFKKNLAPLGFKIYFRDARVEGAQAVENIVNAIKFFNQDASLLVDVLVIIRGGGSLEDLQPFNNEIVAREIFASKIPTICGVGHDRDIPIACLVGDHSPSTPTACAILVNKTWDRLNIDVPKIAQSLIYCFDKMLNNFKSFIHNAPSQFINSFEYLLKNYENKIENYSKYIVSASPERNLKLGYSVVTGRNGKVIKDAKNLNLGEEIHTKLYKGGFTSSIKNINE